MTRIAGANVLFATFAAAAGCGVGGGGTTGTVDSGGTTVDNGEVCAASFNIVGTFVAGTPARSIDPDTNLPITGCWPVGTWTFTAAVASNACPTAPAVLPSYSFRVDRMEGADMQGPVDSYTILSSVGTMQSHIGVSSNGQGCEGSFEFGSADGLQYWNMQPVLPNPATPTGTPSTTLEGSGDYSLYKADAWPWKS